MFTRMEGPAGVLNVNDGGTGGIPVIFIHSATGDATHWFRQLHHLRRTRRAVALDLRGRGLSARPKDNDYRMESQAGDIEAVASRLAFRKFILVGHSMGGSVAIAYAGLHPQRLAGLLLVDTAGDPRLVPVQTVKEIIDSLESDSYENAIETYTERLLRGASAAVHDRILEEVRKADREINVAIIRELFRYDPLPALARYHGPMLSVLTPDNDNEFSLHYLIPDMDHLVVTGTSHWIHLDKPDEFNRILDGFLALVDAESAKTSRRTGT